MVLCNDNILHSEDRINVNRITENRELMMAGYTSVERGCRNSLEYRLFFKDGSGKVVSPMHDIPMLSGEGVYNMVVEVPRWSNAKIEIDLKSPLNPLKQDVKKGKLR